MKRLRLAVLPMWLTSALAVLGAAFVFSYPLGRMWDFYVIALVIGIGYGVLIHRTRRVEVLERHETETERVWLVRITHRRRGSQVSTDQTGTDAPARLDH